MGTAEVRSRVDGVVVDNSSSGVVLLLLFVDPIRLLLLSIAFA
jgi:hypothetical protein